MRGRADEPGGKAMTAVAVGGSVARRPGLPRFLTSEHPLPWLLPSTAMMVVFGVYPLLYAIWLSLHKRNPVTRLSPFNPTWNWAKLFTDDRVWGAIGHTFLYTAVAILVELMLGLLIARLLDSDRRGYGILRALMTLPMLSKIIAVAVLIRGVDLFRIYDYVKVMTDSGPGTATETLTAYAGTIYFKNADFPYASTIALLTLILVMVTANLFIRIFKVKF